MVQGAFVAIVSSACLAGGSGDDDFGLALFDSPMTVEADLKGVAGTPPGGTWKMKSPGGFYCDGLALDGVAFTRNAEPGVDSVFRSYDVVVDLRARPSIDDVTVDLEFVAIEGERQLPLGRFKAVSVRSGEKTSWSETFSLTTYDFDSFFAPGAAPTLRVARTTRALRLNLSRSPFQSFSESAPVVLSTTSTREHGFHSGA